jgi:type IV conjugative transfer system coupling protein TraD
MTGREGKGGIGDFSRGAELWVHQARLLGVALWGVLFLSIIVGFVTAVSYFFWSTTNVERYALERNSVASLRIFAAMTNAKMELYTDGAARMYDVKYVADLTEYDASEALRKTRNGLMIGSLVSIGTCFLLVILWWSYGREKMQDRRLRGAQLVEGNELKRLVERREDASPYVIAGVPMRKGSETLHTLIGGAQGTGKSQQFFRLMAQVRARGKRAIVYDPTGEFTKAFFREGKDILMNPLDERSPHWTIWNEIEKDYHFDNMANGLIPDPAEADPFWSLAGRMVLKDVYRVLGRDGRRTNADLYNAIARSNLESLHTLLAGTAGATYVDPLTERTGMNLKMTVQNQLESFRFLGDKGAQFSIRRWVQEESDSWMFITAREAMREALKPVLSLWIDTAIKAVLDLEPIHKERLWFFIDELPTLQRLDILKLALTNTRKYGLCCVIGIQDFSQLNEIYGQHQARTIISGCQTKLLLRVTDGEAARLLAKLMGEAELDEKEETLSYGLNAQRDGVSVFARRNLRDIVLTSQILTLPDMTGYLTIPGDYPVARVAYEYERTESIAEGFVERDGFGISFLTKSLGAAEGVDDESNESESHEIILNEPTDDDEEIQVIDRESLDPSNGAQGPQSADGDGVERPNRSGLSSALRMGKNRE